MSVVARSLIDLLRFKEKTIELLLPRSLDLVCNNLMCEKVTQTCLCRLERALQSANPRHLQVLDLSGNNLNSLPPHVLTLHELRILNLSNNNFKTIPKELGKLTNLNKIITTGNPLE